MSRRVAARIATPVAAAAVIAAMTAASGGAQTPGARTLTLTELNKGTKSTLIENGPRKRGSHSSRPVVGDQIILSIPIADAAGSTRLGTASATCTVVRVTRSGAPRLTCSGVYELNDGDIVVTGRLSGGNTDRLAVIGGTGAYAGARGTLSSVNGATRTVDTIELLP
jgi:hypothetical protein